jgi:4a-hydroxytetrahydrobiopterin dehydratase
MNELAQMHCSTITAETPRLNDNDINQYLSTLPDWQITLKEGEPRLEKPFQFEDFNQAIDFTTHVARLANEEDHHPAILTEWGKVTVSWWTHKIKGLDQNDFIMAAKTEKLYGEGRLRDY